jgi:hypothetical protein
VGVQVSERTFEHGRWRKRERELIKGERKKDERQRVGTYVRSHRPDRARTRSAATSASSVSTTASATQRQHVSERRKTERNKGRTGAPSDLALEVISTAPACNSCQRHHHLSAHRGRTHRQRRQRAGL